MKSAVLNTFDDLWGIGDTVRIHDETHVLHGYEGQVIGYDDHHVGLVVMGDTQVVIPIENVTRR